jgi:hypothetical protein
VLTLYFDLLGFSGAASRLRIDNVNIVSAADSGNLPPVASSSAIAASEEGAAVALGLSAPTDVDSPLLSHRRQRPADAGRGAIRGRQRGRRQTTR